jgi:2'-5' RNA ligase
VRLFVALTPPPDVQRTVWEAFAPLRGRSFPVKWVPSEGLHLTLKFLGEVSADRREAIVAALGSAVRGARSISLAIAGAGVFPDIERPRVFWAGVEPDPGLELLADQVERSFAPLGFPTEGRAFRPHLTVGRAARDARPRDFTGLGELLDSLAVAAATVVDGVDLMESVLRPAGAVYQRAHRERLS